MPLNHAAASRCDALREYVATSRNFVCGYGRDAFRSGLAKVLTLPACDAPMEDGAGRADIQRAIFEALPHLTTPGATLCLVEPRDAVDHAEGERRAWGAVAELSIAGFGITVDPDAREGQRPRFTRAADLFRRMPVVEEYVAHMPKIRRTSLALFSLNPLYPEGHMRHMPVTVHVVNRLSDVGEAQRKNPAFMKAVQRRMLEDDVPYNADLPYVIPGDDRFTDAGFLQVERKVAEEAGVIGIPPNATVRELARAAYRTILDESTQTVVEFRLEAVRGVLERVIAGGRW